MKKTFILLWTLLLSLNLIHAEEKFRYENTSWKIIRNQYYNGTGSKVTRYYDDIRFQLINASKTDSILINQIISTLNPITETVEIRLDPSNPNFTIEFLPKQSGEKFSFSQKAEYQEIQNTKMKICLASLTDSLQRSNLIHFHIFNKLINKQVHNSRNHTSYPGLLSSKTSEEGFLHEIDLDIIKKLYSKNFNEQFKQITIKQNGHVQYFILTHLGIIRFLILLIIFALTIILLNQILIRNNSTSKKIFFSIYLKQGLLVLTIIFLALQFYSLTQENLIASIKFSQVSFSSFFKIFLPGCLCITLLFFMDKWMKIKNKSFFYKQLAIFISTVLSVGLIQLLYFSTLLTIVRSSQANFSFDKVPISYLYIAVLFALIRTMITFLKHRTQSMINQKDVELAKMTSLKNQAELQALHSRINPHFLYNSLNSIASLAESEPKKVQKMSMALSDLFRYAVNKNNDHTVTVEQELEMVEKYLEVEQVRFGDQFSYSFDVDESAKAIQIPKFLIQPLVENAVKHGISKITEKGILKIYIQQNNKNLNIEVHDNGPDFPEDLVSGYGLQNLHDKLEILYKDEANISWENGENKHIRIILNNQF